MSTPLPPPELLPDPAALAKYAELLADRPQPTVFQRGLMTEYANAHAMYLRAMRELAAAPSITVRGSNGNDFVHPAMKAADVALRQQDRAMRRLSPGKHDEQATATAELEEFLN